MIKLLFSLDADQEPLVHFGSTEQTICGRPLVDWVRAMWLIGYTKISFVHDVNLGVILMNGVADFDKEATGLDPFKITIALGPPEVEHDEASYVTTFAVILKETLSYVEKVDFWFSTGIGAEMVQLPEILAPKAKA